ncbi:hypothetical protein ASG40_10330 [Methylobacterium sp. Leaf399]|uniref:DEAD/DEAH box helicase n=1 Tax=Methylobacterium sp. Leaf399 TaxID=1736364 RepID=UPI0006FE644C|nr:DEAD/DEAH box helicase [Methylobacterium sp. Leaf399]KQT09050.1 hypothetical protein ASG40_10330 [Methylobacterium sp. Leaf399]
METDLIRACLADPDKLAAQRFSIFREVARLANDERTVAMARELVIRLLAHKATLPEGYNALLDALVREVGLFPYADHAKGRDLEDQILVEAHRVHGVGEERFFHSLQLSVFQELVAGRNVVLSAPTSVGKSLVIDAVLATRRHKRAVIVVPTIALIDETRRRIASTLGQSHDIITHSSQTRLEDGRPTVYVLTQERALGRKDLGDVDFFVIDEFYKLDVREEDDERTVDLNLCFHHLARQGAQFYLIGPNISSVGGLAADYRHVFIPSDFTTVALDIQHFNLRQRGEERVGKLVELCGTLAGPTLVYCQSPRSARDAARHVYVGCDLGTCDATRDAADWLAHYYPPEWEVVQALRRGVGIHHGNVPRAIQQYMVRAFEQGKIKILVCTSTIIEGVNTVAENVVIFDRRRNTKTIDDFTFRNIAGRAGRMNRYFVGKVFVLESAVEPGDHTVDLPVGRQDAATPLSLLLDLPEDSLSEVSRDRLAQAFGGSMLDAATIRANRYVPVERQDATCAAVAEILDRDPGLLRWRGVPSSPQLRTVCDLIYDHIDRGNSLRRHGIFAGDQLQAALTALMAADDLRQFVDRRVRERRDDVGISEAVEAALSFLRNYVGYAFGRQLMALSRIQADVILRRERGAPGDYGLFAAQADSLFMPAGLFALDEYGVPAEIASKLMRAWGRIDDVDQGLRMLAGADFDAINLHPFERELLLAVRTYLPSRAYAR